MALELKSDHSIGLTMIYLNRARMALQKEKNKLVACSRCKESERQEVSKALAFIDDLYRQTTARIET